MSSANKDPPSNASHWLTESADAELTSAQKAALADWLRESPTNVRDLLQATLLQEDLRKLKVPASQIEAWVGEAKSAAQQPTPISPTSQPPGKRGDESEDHHGFAFQPRFLPPWLWASVVGLACVLLVVGIFFRWQEGRYTTGVGEQRIVTLLDGSVIEINTNSVIKVHYSAHQRAINLIKGEAFFRVAHDEARPFVVTAGEADVKAVGTQFNVRMGNDDTLVSVVEGTVEVRNDAAQAAGGPPAALRVSTGEQARITSVRSRDSAQRLTLAKITPSAPAQAASWTRGRVEFEDTPIGDVLSEFQRYQEINVTFDDDAIRQLKLTGSFDAHDPESALAYIATLPDIIVEKVDGRTYRLHRRGGAASPQP